MKLVLFFLMINAFGAKSDVVHIKSDGLPIKAKPSKQNELSNFSDKEVYKIISKEVA